MTDKEWDSAYKFTFYLAVFGLVVFIIAIINTLFETFSKHFFSFYLTLFLLLGILVYAYVVFKKSRNKQLSKKIISSKLNSIISIVAIILFVIDGIMLSSNNYFIGLVFIIIGLIIFGSKYCTFKNATLMFSKHNENQALCPQCSEQLIKDFEKHKLICLHCELKQSSVVGKFKDKAVDWVIIISIIFIFTGITAWSLIVWKHDIEACHLKYSFSNDEERDLDYSECISDGILGLVVEWWYPLDK